RHRHRTWVMTSYLPWLLLVVTCPLMMFVMMRRMGGGKDADLRAARSRPTGSNPMNRRWTR
ncbi:MAG: DUF2933 domain-containing protein, partial [Allobranchiibius sp.]